MTYTLVEEKADAYFVNLEASLEAIPVETPGMEGMGGQLTMSGTMTGTAQLDVKTGWVTEMTTTMDGQASGSIPMAEPGPTHVELTVTTRPL